MNCTTRAKNDYKFGFCLIDIQKNLKLSLDRSGHQGLVSLLGALIASGINTDEDIKAEVAAISGDHYDDYVTAVLDEYAYAANPLWFQGEDGQYILNHH